MTAYEYEVAGDQMLQRSFRKHLRYWGAVYLLVILFIGSWVGQAVAMSPEITTEGWVVFWAATFENWQSEWLQLVFQAILLLAAKHLIFKADARDQERMEHKLDTILAMMGKRKGQPRPTRN